MNIKQLNSEQIEELARAYLIDHYHEYNPDAAELEGPSYGELAAAVEIVGIDALMEEYDSTVFSNDDFSCTAGQPERQARHYYAIYSPQGIHAPSTADTLYRYDTAQQRAEDIDRVNLQTTKDRIQAVPRAFAKKRYPRAFAHDAIVWRTWSDGDRHFNRPFWRDYEDGTQEWTGKPRNVIFDTYEVRQIDAWMYDDNWTCNDSWNLGTFTTTGDPAQALRRYLKRHHNITFYRGRTRTEYDGDVYEIVDRKTGEPLFAAIPTE